MISSLVLLFCCITAISVTGVAVLHAGGVRFRYWIDLLLGMFAIGVSALGASVFVLLLLNCYLLSTAGALLLAPLVYLGWQGYSGNLVAILPDERDPFACIPVSKVEGVIALLCLVFLIVSVVECLITPMTVWDAVVSWDKWATEWALRTNMYERKLALYPQLLPMISSLLYKITGTSQEPIPLTQFALHAIHPSIGLILLLSTIRLASILRIAAWPGLVVFFGSVTMAWITKAAIGDLLSSTLVLTCITLTLSAVIGGIRFCLPSTIFFFLVFFGPVFMKSNNIVILLLPAVIVLMRWRGRIEWPALPSGMIAGIGFALLLFSVFVVHQFLNIGTSTDRLHLDELNFESANISSSLAGKTASRFSGDTVPVRARKTTQLLLADYEIPEWAHIPSVVVAVIAIFAASFVPRLWPLIVVVIVQVGIWAYYTAYDTRNLAPVIPLLGLTLAAGFAALTERGGASERPKSLGYFLLSLVAAIGFGYFGLRVASETEKSAKLIFTKWDGNLRAINSPLPARIQHFFPMESAGYQFMQSLRPFRDAKHIMAGYHLYRWLPNGGYPLSTWNMNGLLPGDGVAFLTNTLPLRRPYYDRLTQVYHDGQQRLYLVDVAPVVLNAQQLLAGGTNPPRITSDGSGLITVSPTGEGGWLAYEAPEVQRDAGDSLIWRVHLSGALPDPAVTSSFYQSESENAVDSAKSRAVSDTARTAEGVAVYSGIVTFTGQPVGKLRVGIRVPAGGAPVTIREFRISNFDKRSRLETETQPTTGPK